MLFWEVQKGKITNYKITYNPISQVLSNLLEEFYRFSICTSESLMTLSDQMYMEFIITFELFKQYAFLKFV